MNGPFGCRHMSSLCALMMAVNVFFEVLIHTIVLEGMVFLTYRDETKRGLLPNEITSISTVWALFVRAFPDHLTMRGFEMQQSSFVCILNRATKAYRPLADLRSVPMGFNKSI